MIYKLVKTSAPHKVYLVDDLVMHDTRGVNVSRQAMADAALEAFGEEGSLGKQLRDRRPGEGLMLQTTNLKHYIVASINKNFAVSSKEHLTPEVTRKIVKEFLTNEKESL